LAVSEVVAIINSAASRLGGMSSMNREPRQEQTGAESNQNLEIQQVDRVKDNCGACMMGSQRV